MSGPDEPHAPVSGAPLGSVEPPVDGGAADQPRYEIGGLLGRGGMGDVHVARDRVLGRDVAVKTVRAGAEAARLAREAAMTAGLEHPGIMPVYDAGVSAEGLAFYTMRVLPGRSLADALRVTPAGPERLRLVRHLLDAAEAIAYAHGRGVLHRDLKPANIMVGSFGETVVSDWGLACTVDDGARGGGAGLGTPGFMSPEQRGGRPLDARTDVYGLGGVLFELLVGQPPPPEGAAPPVRSVAPAAPPALAAVADRALQAEPDLRYPSARTFADDLLAWFEGRRVSAHVYGLGELLALLLAAWRVPLAVGAAGALALAVAVGVGWWRTAEARRAEELAFGRALVAQARSAAAADEALEAEVLAANALLRLPSPEARGVLARFARAPRFTLESAGPPLPDCHARALTSDGGRLLCLTRAQALLFDPFEAEPIARLEGSYLYGAFGAPDRVLLADEAGGAWLWALGEPARPVADLTLLGPSFGVSEIPGRVATNQGSDDIVVDLFTGVVARARSCGWDRVSAVVALRADGARAVGCADRRLLLVDPEGAARVLAELSEEEGPPMLLAPRGADLLVATSRGWVLLFDASGRRLAARRFQSDAPRRMLAQGDQVALVSQNGALHLWRPETDAGVPRMPVADAEVAWLATGGLRLVGGRAEDRAVPDGVDRHRAALGAGVAALAFDPSGARLAVAAGDGAAHVLDAHTLAPLRRWRWQENVAKAVAWSPDGRSLAVATAGGEQRVFDVGADRVLASYAGLTSRRVAWTKAGLVFGGYRDEVRWYPEAEGEGERVHDAQIVDFDWTGDEGAALDREGGVYVARGGVRPGLVLRAKHPTAEAVAYVRGDIWVAAGTRLVRYDASGSAAESWEALRGVTDLAVSPDASLLAIGYLDGTAAVRRLDGGERLATLVGHRGRVAAVAFSPDGRTLATGAWDESVRLWSMDGLEEPPRGVIARVEGAWGRDLSALAEGPR